MEELENIEMTSSHYLQENVFRVKQLRSDRAAYKESVNDRQYKDIWRAGYRANILTSSLITIRRDPKVTTLFVRCR